MLVGSRWQRIYYIIKENKLDYLIVFLLAFILFAWLQSAPTMVDPDGFYHAKMAETMRDNLVVQDFQWLQGTGLDEYFVDHHWLYHFLLTIFIILLPTLVGVKLASALFAGLLILTIYYLLKKHNGKWPFLFILLLITIQPFIFRLSLVKATPLALIVLLLGLEFAIHYKYALVLVLSFVYVWLYGGFILLPLMIILWLTIDFFYQTHNRDFFRTKLINIKNYFLSKTGFSGQSKGKKWLVLFSSLLGVVMGVISHPYAQNSLAFYKNRILDVVILNNYSGLNIGTEWLSYNWSSLFSIIGPILIVLLATAGLLISTQRKISKYTAFIGVAAFIFLILTTGTRRYIEYFSPLAIIFLCLAWRDALGKLSWQGAWKKLNKNKLYLISSFIIVLVLIMGAGQNIILIKKYHNQAKPVGYLSSAATWLKFHTPDNSLIINDNWADWSRMFYYNDSNNYLVGFDPRLMLDKYPYSSVDYANLMSGNKNLNPSLILKGKLNGDYLLIRKENQKLNTIIEGNIYFNLEYEDNEAWVYKIQ